MNNFAHAAAPMMPPAPPGHIGSLLDREGELLQQYASRLGGLNGQLVALIERTFGTVNEAQKVAVPPVKTLGGTLGKIDAAHHDLEGELQQLANIVNELSRL